MDNSKNYTCEYFTFLKRQRKKMWGKRAEKPRWRLINKLLRQRNNKNLKSFSEKVEEIGKRMKKILNEVGIEINDQLKKL